MKATLLDDPAGELEPPPAPLLGRRAGAGGSGAWRGGDALRDVHVLRASGHVDVWGERLDGATPRRVQGLDDAVEIDAADNAWRARGRGAGSCCAGARRFLAAAADGSGDRSRRRRGPARIEHIAVGGAGVCHVLERAGGVACQALLKRSSRSRSASAGARTCRPFARCSGASKASTTPTRSSSARAAARDEPRAYRAGSCRGPRKLTTVPEPAGSLADDIPGTADVVRMWGSAAHGPLPTT